MHLITGGCSFSHHISTDNWTICLTEWLTDMHPEELSYEHTGYRSQGQDLIQKKVMLACIEAMERGINPNDILVVVMWSGTYRKAWYINNKEIIQKMVDSWPNYEGGMSPQFIDLKNEYTGDTKIFNTKYGTFEYSEQGGWYFSVDGSDCPLEFVQQHYKLDGYPQYGVGKTHSSLENIITLQNFCKLHGIKLIQQFFMDFVYRDIEEHKDHQIINYLYKQLDNKNIIKDGMFEYLHQFIGIERSEAMYLSHQDRIKLNDNKGIFDADGFHPGVIGHKLWTDNILKPFIKNRM